MGTNYYWNRGRPPCPTCGIRPDGEGLHIGKNSAGWTFSLQGHEDPPLKTWQAWKAALMTGEGEIVSEYGEVLHWDAFVSLVEGKQRALWHDGIPLLNHAARWPGVHGNFLDPEGYSFSMGGFS